MALGSALATVLLLVVGTIVIHQEVFDDGTRVLPSIDNQPDGLLIPAFDNEQSGNGQYGLRWYTGDELLAASTNYFDYDADSDRLTVNTDGDNSTLVLTGGGGSITTLSEGSRGAMQGLHDKTHRVSTQASANLGYTCLEFKEPTSEGGQHLRQCVPHTLAESLTFAWPTVAPESGMALHAHPNGDMYWSHSQFALYDKDGDTRVSTESSHGMDEDQIDFHVDGIHSLSLHSIDGAIFRQRVNATAVPGARQLLAINTGGVTSASIRLEDATEIATHTGFCAPANLSGMDLIYELPTNAPMAGQYLRAAGAPDADGLVVTSWSTVVGGASNGSDDAITNGMMSEVSITTAASEIIFEAQNVGIGTWDTTALRIQTETVFDRGIQLSDSTDTKAFKFEAHPTMTETYAVRMPQTGMTTLSIPPQQLTPVNIIDPGLSTQVIEMDWVIPASVGVSGTINNIAKFTASGSVGDSQISDDGTTVTLPINLKVGSSSTAGHVLTASGTDGSVSFAAVPPSVTISGTTNTISKFNGAGDNVEDSLITDDGVTVGLPLSLKVGTTSTTGHVLTATAADGTVALQALPVYPTVSGTTNTLAKFTGTGAVGDSQITDDGTTVGLPANLKVGTTSTMGHVLTATGAADGTVVLAAPLTPSELNEITSGLGNTHVRIDGSDNIVATSNGTPRLYVSDGHVRTEGPVQIGAQGSTASAVVFYDDDEGNTASVAAPPAVTTNTQLNLPGEPGTDNKMVLVTDAGTASTGVDTTRWGYSDKLEGGTIGDTVSVGTNSFVVQSSAGLDPIIAAFSGQVTVGSGPALTDGAEVRLMDGTGTGYISLKGPNTMGATDVILKFPGTTPLAGQILKVTNPPGGNPTTAQLIWDDDQQGDSTGIFNTPLSTVFAVADTSNLLLGATLTGKIDATIGGTGVWEAEAGKIINKIPTHFRDTLEFFNTAGTFQTTFNFQPTADYTLNWPQTQAPGVRILENDGAGNLAWVALPSSADHTRIDNTASTTSVTTTVANTIEFEINSLQAALLDATSFALLGGRALSLSEPVGTDTIDLTAPAGLTGGGYGLALPVDLGMAGQVLTTGADGTTSWTSVAGAGASARIEDADQNTFVDTQISTDTVRIQAGGNVVADFLPNAVVMNFPTTFVSSVLLSSAAPTGGFAAFCEGQAGCSESVTIQGPDAMATAAGYIMKLPNAATTQDGMSMLHQLDGSSVFNFAERLGLDGSGGTVVTDDATDTVTITSAGISDTTTMIFTPTSAVITTPIFAIDGGGATSGGGRIRLHEQDAALGNFVSLRAPDTVATSVDYTLPAAAPGTTQGMTMDSSGQIAFTPVLSVDPTRITDGVNTFVDTDENAATINMQAGGVPVLDVTATGLTDYVGTLFKAFIKIEDPQVGTNGITINTPDALAADWTLTLPPTVGTVGQFLQNTGSGVTQWADLGVDPTRIFADSNNYVDTDEVSNAVTINVFDAFLGTSSGQRVGQFTASGFSTLGAITIDRTLTNDASRLNFKTDDDKFVTIRAGATVAGASSVLILPTTTPNAGDVLVNTNGGVGQLGWVAPSTFGDATAITDGLSSVTKVETTEIGNSVTVTANGEPAAQFTGTATNLYSQTLSLIPLGGNTASQLRLYEDEVSTGLEYVGLQAPSDVGTSYVITLPADGPTGAGQILETDAGGQLSWVTPTVASQNRIFNGNLQVIVNSANVETYIEYGGGARISSRHNSQRLDIFSTIFMNRDGRAGVAAFAADEKTGIAFLDSGASRWIKLIAPDSIGGSNTQELRLPNTDPLVGQVLAVTAKNTVAFIDEIDTAWQYPARVEDSTAASQILTLATGTEFRSSGTAIAVVDGNGVSLPASNALIFQDGAGNDVSLVGPTSGGDYVFTLPPSAGTSGQVLQTDGAGVTTWVALESSTNQLTSASTISTAGYDFGPRVEAFEIFSSGVQAASFQAVGINLRLPVFMGDDAGITFNSGVTSNSVTLKAQPDGTGGLTYNIELPISPASSPAQTLVVDVAGGGTSTLKWGYPDILQDQSSTANVNIDGDNFYVNFDNGNSYVDCVDTDCIFSFDATGGLESVTLGQGFVDIYESSVVDSHASSGTLRMRNRLSNIFTLRPHKDMASAAGITFPQAAGTVGQLLSIQSIEAGNSLIMEWVDPPTGSSGFPITDGSEQIFVNDNNFLFRTDLGSGFASTVELGVDGINVLTSGAGFNLRYGDGKLWRILPAATSTSSQVLTFPADDPVAGDVLTVTSVSGTATKTAILEWAPGPGAGTSTQILTGTTSVSTSSAAINAAVSGIAAFGFDATSMNINWPGTTNPLLSSATVVSTLSSPDTTTTLQIFDDIIMASTGRLEVRNEVSSTTAPGELWIYEASGNGGDSVQIKAPDNLPGSYSLVLPGNVGNNGDVLRTDGTGTLSWVPVGGTVSRISDGETSETFAEITANTLEVQVDDVSVATFTDTGAFLRQGATITGSTVVEGAAGLRLNHVGAGSAPSICFQEAGGQGDDYICIGARQDVDVTAYALRLPPTPPTANQVLTAGATTPTELEWAAPGTASFISTGTSSVNTGATEITTILGGTTRTTVDVSRHRFTSPAGTSQLEIRDSFFEFQSNVYEFKNGIGTTSSPPIIALYNSAGGASVQLRAPGALASSYTLTLPDNDGDSGQTLTTDGSGVLSWVTPAGGGGIANRIESAVNTNHAVDVSNGVQGFIYVPDLAGTGQVPLATWTRTVGLVMTNQLQLSSYTEGTASAGRLSFSDQDGSNKVVLLGPTDISADYTLELPNTDGSNGQVLSTDGSGKLSFQTITAPAPSSIQGSVNPLLEFDLTDNLIGVLWTNDIFNSNQLIMSRWSTNDGMEFWNRVTVRGYAVGGGSPGRIIFKDQDDSHGVSVTGPTAITADYTLELPDTDGTSGQVLTTDGAGKLSFTTPGGTPNRIQSPSTFVAVDTSSDAVGYLYTGGNVGTAQTTFALWQHSSGLSVLNKINLANYNTGSAQPAEINWISGDDNALVRLQGPATLATSYTLSWPITGPSAGQSLQSDGSGQLSWVTVSGGGGGGNLISDADSDVTVTDGSDVTTTLDGVDRIVVGTTNTVLSAPTPGTSRIELSNSQIDWYTSDMNILPINANAPTMSFFEGNAGSAQVLVKAQNTAMISDWVFEWPSTQGTNGQALVSSVLGITATAEWGYTSQIATGTTDVVTTANSITGSVSGDTSFTFNAAGSTINYPASAQAMLQGTTTTSTWYSPDSTTNIQMFNDIMIIRTDRLELRNEQAVTGSTAELWLFEASANGGDSVKIQSPTALPFSWTLTLPENDGDNGQVLTTDGSGVTSWATAAGGAVSSIQDTSNGFTSVQTEATGGQLDFNVANVGNTASDLVATFTDTRQSIENPTTGAYMRLDNVGVQQVSIFDGSGQNLLMVPGQTLLTGDEVRIHNGGSTARLLLEDAGASGRRWFGFSATRDRGGGNDYKLFDFPLATGTAGQVLTVGSVTGTGSNNDPHVHLLDWTTPSAGATAAISDGDSSLSVVDDASDIVSTVVAVIDGNQVGAFTSNGVQTPLAFTSFGDTSTRGGQINLASIDNTGAVTLQGPASGLYTLILPSASGSAGDMLKYSSTANTLEWGAPTKLEQGDSSVIVTDGTEITADLDGTERLRIDSTLGQLVSPDALSEIALRDGLATLSSNTQIDLNADSVIRMRATSTLVTLYGPTISLSRPIGSTAPQLRFGSGDGANYIAFKSPDTGVTTAQVVTLPNEPTFGNIKEGHTIGFSSDPTSTQYTLSYRKSSVCSTVDFTATYVDTSAGGGSVTFVNVYNDFSNLDIEMVGAHTATDTAPTGSAGKVTCSVFEAADAASLNPSFGRVRCNNQSGKLIRTFLTNVVLQSISSQAPAFYSNMVVPTGLDATQAIGDGNSDSSGLPLSFSAPTSVSAPQKIRVTMNVCTANPNVATV